MERRVDILNELNAISPVVAGIGNATVFAVPDGYFDTVAATVLNSINDETLTGKDVPAGYFDSLPNNILAKIEGTVAHELNVLSPLLAGIKKENPFAVPANYFEKFAVDVEEEKMPAILKGLNELHPFDLMAGYFDNLPASIISRAKEESGAKVVAMPKGRFAVMKYAAAAVFTGMVAFGVYNYTGKTTGRDGDGPIAMDEKKFNETLDKLPEEDIIQYLEKNGSEADVAALASGIDESTLPSQEEYFTDDEALDKFLEEINTKN